MMIVFLHGTVDRMTLDSVYINVSGVGYEVFTPTSVMSTVVVGQEIRLYTYHHIREDDQRLFGFSDAGDLELFSLLISVNGIGPKAGIAILSTYRASDIVSAIERGDERLFSSVSGIGKKGAAKIVIDLKGKVRGITSSKSAVQDTLVSSVDSNDLVDALVALGYSEREVFSHMSKIDMSAPLQTQIKQMLGFLGK